LAQSSAPSKGGFRMSVTTQPIRNKRQLKRLARYFLEKEQYINHLLLVLGSHTALCISDIKGLLSRSLPAHANLNGQETGYGQIAFFRIALIRVTSSLLSLSKKSFSDFEIVLSFLLRSINSREQIKSAT